MYGNKRYTSFNYIIVGGGEEGEGGGRPFMDIVVYNKCTRQLEVRKIPVVNPSKAKMSC